MSGPAPGPTGAAVLAGFAWITLVWAGLGLWRVRGGLSGPGILGTLLGLGALAAAYAAGLHTLARFLAPDLAAPPAEGWLWPALAGGLVLGAGSAGLLLGLTGCPRLPRPRLTGLRDRLYVLALNRGYEEVVFTVLFVRPWATLAHRVPRRTGSWGGMAAGRGGRWF